jgi:hypothetical protein
MKQINPTLKPKLGPKRCHASAISCNQTPLIRHSQKLPHTGPTPQNRSNQQQSLRKFHPLSLTHTSDFYGYLALPLLKVKVQTILVIFYDKALCFLICNSRPLITNMPQIWEC